MVPFSVKFYQTGIKIGKNAVKHQAHGIKVFP